MCKLNLLCTLEDDQCTCSCSEKSLEAKEKSNLSQKGLLCSILQLIQSQPSIMKVLSEASSSKNALSEVIPSLESPDSSESSISEHPQVRVLSELAKVLQVGKSFPLMVEVFGIDKENDKSQDLTFKAYLEEQSTGKEICCLGKVISNKTAFFRKLIVSETCPKCDLVVEVEGRKDIQSFRNKVCVKQKKKVDITFKKSKTQEVFIE
jgi:hypothetical protein